MLVFVTMLICNLSEYIACDAAPSYANHIANVNISPYTNVINDMLDKTGQSLAEDFR